MTSPTTKPAASSLHGTKCKFCDCPLPEPGYNKYFVVDSIDWSGAPSCVACNLRLKTKVVGLMSPRTEEP